jgi:DNA-binding MarR family transcriptional regulator
MSKSSSKRPSALAIDLLIRDILFCYFRLNASGERMFAAVGQKPGKVSLMRSLKEEGPQSVAQLARSRPVARQGVQRMADELSAAGLIEFVANPSHRRAKLARLTTRGRVLMEKAMAGELRWTARLAHNFSAREVETTRDVIRRLKQILGEQNSSRASSGRVRASRANL